MLAPTSPTREVVFFGTPDIAAQVLTDLLDAGVRVVAVVTTPDKRRGRGNATEASPAKKIALARGIRIIETADEAVEFLAGHGTDDVTGVVVAYGRIIREPLLSLIPLVNLHFSLLPRWRGAAPVERAILAGDRETGSSIMQIEAGLDTGAVYGVERITIDDDESVEELRSRLGTIGATQLLNYLGKGFPVPVPQIGEALHAEKIGVDDLRIDWNRPAVQVKRQVRLGGAFTFFRGQRLKIHRVSIGDLSGESSCGTVLAVEKSGVKVAASEGSVCLESVQPEGKKPMAAADWVNGVRPSVGETFDSH